MSKKVVSSGGGGVIGMDGEIVFKTAINPAPLWPLLPCQESGISHYPGQRERSPDYQKLYARDIHIRDIRKGQPNRSAMEKPRPGGTAFLITVTSAPEMVHYFGTLPYVEVATFLPVTLSYFVFYSQSTLLNCFYQR
uniref:Uncharacterized protein n=1 Tax=Vespula pensylvanica TaxID=30213 RepID=A0A834P8A1_VESPE|nr:hypothetical protein H0235_004394 [Vespula pensylvanica]